MNEFFNAYVTCALWSSSDESTPSGGDPLDQNYGVSDIAPETLARMRADCERFASENAAIIDGEGESAGHDFWLTRNGHGAGFWDGDWSEDAGQRLTAASKRFGEYNLHVGDDGKIHGG